MGNKFTEEYVKELLSKEFSCINLSIMSSYGFDYNRKYDKTSIVDIDYYYSTDFPTLSLDEAKGLRDFLSDLIEYYEINDSNPTLLTIEDKKKILLEKIKEDNTGCVLTLSLDELPEDKLDRILKYLTLI